MTDKTAYPITPLAPAEVALVRSLWQKHNGIVHGPKTETVSMAEEDFHRFMAEWTDTIVQALALAR